MNAVMLEIAKLLTSISISEKIGEQLKEEAYNRLMKIMPLIDDEIESLQEHNKLLKEQMLKHKFMS